MRSLPVSAFLVSWCLGGCPALIDPSDHCKELPLPLEKIAGSTVDGQLYEHPNNWFEVMDGQLVFEGVVAGGSPPFRIEVWGPVLERGELIEGLYATGLGVSVTFPVGHSGIYRVVLIDSAGFSLEWSIGVAVIVE